MPEFAWFSWLTDRKVLIGYGDKSRDFDFYWIDRFTGIKHAIHELNSSFLMWNHLSFSISPDGRFATWREAGDYGDSYVVASLDGSGFVHRWRGGGLYEPLVWQSDSRYWCSLSREKFASYYSTAIVRDRKAPAWRKVLKLPPETLTWSAMPTLRGTLLSYLKGDTLAETHRIVVTECRLLPRPRRLHRYRVAIPNRGKLCAIELSPRADRIAWTFSQATGKPGIRRRTVWVSTLQGRRWREVGGIDIPAKDDNEWGIEAGWLPSGNALSVYWHNEIWIVPLVLRQRDETYTLQNCRDLATSPVVVGSPAGSEHL